MRWENGVQPGVVILEATVAFLRLSDQVKTSAIRCMEISIFADLRKTVLFSLNNPKPEFSSLTESDYRQAFEEYFDGLRNFLYYKTGDRNMAEDLAQDTFVKLWENRDRIDKKTLKSYLYTIGSNTAINQLKRKQLQYKFQRMYVAGVDKQSPEYLAEMKEYEVILQKVIADMPDGSREVFLMNRLEDMKYREIAETLGISVKAVEKRMSKALKIIRDKLDVNI
jgi:RNA polymerase sigma-70 factor (family 1)